MQAGRGLKAFISPSNSSATYQFRLSRGFRKPPIELLNHLAPFKLTAEQCGVFPTHGPPRVLWIGITDISGQLARFHTRLDEECEVACFPKESRPFHPHLTLARIRHSTDARALGVAHRNLDFAPVEFDVRELLVIRSELGKAGSKYTTVSRHPLASDAHD